MIDLTFWLKSPCPLQANIFRELSKFNDVNISLIFQQDLNNFRKELCGWKMPTLKQVDFEILPESNWKGRIIEILEKKSKSLHIFGSLIKHRKLNYARKKSFCKGLKVGIITEQSVNQVFGLRRFFRAIELRLQRLLVPNIAQKTRLVLAISYSESEYFNKLGWNDKKIYPYGYFADKIKRSKTLKNREDNDSIKICYSGSLFKKKLVDTLINALSILEKEFSNFSCRIIGEGPERKKLEKLVELKKLKSKINFIGATPNESAREIINGSDIIVVPGFVEPWGVPVNEGIMGGTAVVVSNGVGARKLVEVGKCGRIFQRGNAKSLYEAIHSLIFPKKNLIEAKNNALKYSKYISPSKVAEYLRQVILHVRGDIKEKPIPPWLKYGGNFE